MYVFKLPENWFVFNVLSLSLGSNVKPKLGVLQLCNRAGGGPPTITHSPVLPAVATSLFSVLQSLQAESKG